MNGLLKKVEVLLVDIDDVGEVACDPGDVDQGEDNPGNLAEKKMKENMDFSFKKYYSPVPACPPRGCASRLFSETEEIYFDFDQKPQICKDGTAEAKTVRRQTAHSMRLTIRA